MAEGETRSLGFRCRSMVGVVSVDPVRLATGLAALGGVLSRARERDDVAAEMDGPRRALAVDGPATSDEPARELAG